MTQRRKWTAIPGLIALAIGAVVLSAYTGASSSQGRGPVKKMDGLFQYSWPNMGWGVNCHVSGYHPKEGQKAAGYDSVPPATSSGGSPYGPPGPRAGFPPAGAGMTPPGMGLPRDTAT